MAKVGAQRAAELTGKSKSTIQRAMNAGKLSFEVDANSRRLIDVSELERVFGIQSQNESSAPAQGTQGGINAAVEVELEKARHAIEIERLRMEVRMAQDQADAAARQIEDLKVQRDLWQKQAQQILITSQYSQKQAEERITEMQAKEEARQRQVEARRLQQGAINHARPGQQAARPAASQQSAPAERVSAPAAPQQQSGGPVFRTVPTSNQNRGVATQPGEKTSLFASLFGLNKKSKRA